MSKKFLTDVIAKSADMSGVAAGRVAADLIAAIKSEIISTGRFTLPEFGAFIVRETPKRTALNPRTGREGAGEGRRHGALQGQPDPEGGRAGRGEEAREGRREGEVIPTGCAFPPRRERRPGRVDD
jgi:nucleoid DNA-binding protein